MSIASHVFPSAIKYDAISANHKIRTEHYRGLETTTAAAAVLINSNRITCSSSSSISSSNRSCGGGGGGGVSGVISLLLRVYP